jgi:tetratricopeptide (TPR) repeat protein
VRRSIEIARRRSYLAPVLMWAVAFLIAILPAAWFLVLFVHEHLHLLAHLVVTGHGGWICYFDDSDGRIGLFVPADGHRGTWFTAYAPWLGTIALGAGAAHAFRCGWSQVVKVLVWTCFAVSAIAQVDFWIVGPSDDALLFQESSGVSFRIVGTASFLAAIAPILWMTGKAARQRPRATAAGGVLSPAAVSVCRHPVRGAVPILLLLGLATSYPFYVNYGYRHVWMSRRWTGQEKAYRDAFEKGDYLEARRSAEVCLITAERMGVGSAYYVQSLVDLGDLCRTQSEFPRAERLAKRAVDIVEDMPQLDYERLLDPLALLGIVYGQHGRFREAEVISKRALRVATRVYGEESPRIWLDTYQLGALYREMGRYDEAERLIKQGLKLHERLDPGDETGRASILRNLGVLYLRQREYTKARSALEESLAIRERHYGGSHFDVALSMNSLAELDIAEGRLADAGKLLARAMQIETKVLRPEHVQIAETLHLQAVLDIAQGDYDEAEPMLRRALQIRERALTPDHPDIARTLETYSALLKKTGRAGEAAKMHSRAKTIFAKWGMAAPTGTGRRR